MRTISILGSTGSIGTQALEVADACGDVKISGLSANQNVKMLEEQARKYKPEKVCIMQQNLYTDLKLRLKDTAVAVVCGREGLCEIATLSSADAVLTSVVGNVGLVPTIAAIQAHKKILLANKETLVTSGSIIMPLAQKCGVDILPVDSEHSAIFQCLQGNQNNKISKILLTASGGPFFGKTKDTLQKVTKADALKHPNWSMGAKITIDSATMMNKGLEVIEAKWLFDVAPEQIEIYVHRQSIVHSAVEFEDHSVIAQMGIPDMKLPIVYALNYPNRKQAVSEKLDLFQVHSLTFDKPDFESFPCLQIALDAAKRGGSVPTVMNAANEIAVDAFLKEKIGFYDIPAMIQKTIDAHSFIQNPTVEDVLQLDTWARAYASSIKFLR